MKSHSTYTKVPITEEVAKSGSQNIAYELNGGAKKLIRMIEHHTKKTGQSKPTFAKAIGLADSAICAYSRGRHRGISMRALRKFAKAFGMSAFELGQKLKLGGNVKAKAGAKNGAKPPKQIGKLLAALGVGQAELACSFTIGEDRITVERMPGQDEQPVVVEHNGHRLTIAKA